MAQQPRDPGLLILSDHLTNPYVVTTALARSDIGIYIQIVTLRHY